MAAKRTTAKAGAKTRTRKPQRPTGKAKAVLDRPPPFQGWNTTDDDEIERRRWRGRTEIASVDFLDPDRQPVFGDAEVRSSGGGGYVVEIRSLTERINSCGCHDHRVNGLGTCKHVEGALDALRRQRGHSLRQAMHQGLSRVEIFLDRAAGPAVRVLWPAFPQTAPEPLRHLLAPHLTSDGTGLAGEPAAALAVLRTALSTAPPDIQAGVRVSRHLDAWAAEQTRRAARAEARRQFLAEVEAGRQSFDTLRHPLLPYQREGMLHLAFTERALLADEMGLGKTVQAIAACDLLRRLRGIERVLVVCPASLKGEWLEQVDRFTGQAVRLVAGSRVQRLAAYRDAPPFITVVNYEQVVSDAADINALLRPDVVVLDEAQRIKNWQTKTARAVKSLSAPYAFVLTGTPLENNIDEVYSIVQYLDPGLLGPLFRFNRDFYELDERGRPVDYRNLDELYRRLRPVMLRRRKAEVEEQLPGRTVTTYFVGMADEQRLRYEDYEGPAARLLAQAQRRPLTRQEFDRLQQLLACMRMVCDTPAILDPTCRVSPKLEELERVLADLFAEPDRKVIIFSEWERMLDLARELVRDMGLEYSWHTGSVPQIKRRAEIERFKRDPACRVFLSTDSGSVGLNLQAANAVVNLDLPWNPARLEQRIARAWRKNQMRAVTVVNLVTENSIEHRILHLLDQKQGLADGVLDGQGDLGALKMPSGRTAFLDRLRAMMDSRQPAVPETPAEPPPPPADPAERRVDALRHAHGDELLLAEVHHTADGRGVVLAVVEDGVVTHAAADADDGDGLSLERIDRATFETIQRLVAAGILSFADTAPVRPHRSDSLDQDAAARARTRRRAAAGEAAEAAGRKLRMAEVLTAGGFADESRTPLAEAASLAADAARRLDDPALAEPLAGFETILAAEPPAGELRGCTERLLARVRDALGVAVPG
jgi:hypothetical protein